MTGLESFRQSDQIRDYIFPLCVVAGNPGDGWEVERFLGTGFLIGNRGYALTAAHVICDHRDSQIVAMFAHRGGWWVSVAQPFPSRRVAQVCLRSWKRMWETGLFLMS